MGDNTVLRDRIVHLSLTRTELAHQMNLAIQDLTGRYGTVSERTIHDLLTRTRWPHAKQRAALRAVFGCPAEELGFTPPGSHHPPAPTENDVLRRTFLTATTGTAVAAVPLVSAPRRIGSGDIQRLQTEFAGIIASDHRDGGTTSIETQAVALADQALALQQQGTASQRIRGGLYASAASFTSSAMWAAIDGRRFGAAQQHLDRASSLAAMSGDPSIAFRIWSHAGTLYRHLGRPADGLAANNVARNSSISRRDPLFASLGHARHAAILGLTGDTAAVERAIGHAQEALNRADPGAYRPVWITAFYDQAELDSLALAAYLSLHQYEHAEARAHRTLSVLRPHLQRSRAIATARLAHAQLGQADLEPAITTAMSIPNQGPARHPRITGMLDAFGRRLHAIARDSAHTQLWDQYAQDTRRNPA